jgi:hypothetical protein
MESVESYRKMCLQQQTELRRIKLISKSIIRLQVSVAGRNCTTYGVQQPP